MKAHIAVLFQLASLSHSYVTSMPFLSRTRSATGTGTGHQNPRLSSALPFQQPPLVPATTLRGGGNTKLKASSDSKCPITGIATALTSLWGVGGVVYILAKAIRRVLPIALEPFQGGHVSLSNLQLGAYIATCLWFAYVEGYKGFQTKFSPLVVKRAFTLVPGRSNVLHILLAPLYSMGLIHATKKRLIVSWSVTIGVTAIVAIVKQCPYPVRNMIDGGVVTGLTWGAISMLAYYMKSWWTGTTPSIDPALPAQ